ncbi:MAG: response regulator transcription factor [Vicingaceae bacterium]
MTKKPKILLAEDEPNFGAVLENYLRLAQFNVDWCKDGKRAYSKMQNEVYDLCVLDVMMPEMDGFTLAKEIKQQCPTTPFIFLTAKSMKEDVLKGFKLGADDYLTKPFDSDILIEKIKVLLKRRQQTSTSVEATEYQIGTYRFKPSSRKLSHPETELRLSPKETALLHELCRYKNEVMIRSEALEKIWGNDNYFTGRSMDVYMAKLRKYLSKDEKVNIINIHGNGFQLSD